MQGFKVEQTVKVVKAPEEAPHLLGKTGTITHIEGRYARVRIGDAFTHFQRDEIALSPPTRIA